MNNVPFLCFYFRKTHAKRIFIGIGMFIGLVLLGILLVIIILLISTFLKNLNTDTMAYYNRGLSTLFFQLNSKSCCLLNHYCKRFKKLLSTSKYNNPRYFWNISRMKAARNLRFTSFEGDIFCPFRSSNVLFERACKTEQKATYYSFKKLTLDIEIFFLKLLAFFKPSFFDYKSFFWYDKGSRRGWKMRIILI